MNSSAEVVRGTRVPEAAQDRVHCQPVWDGTEILRVVGEAVVDFAAECEHRILVLEGVGRLRLADQTLDLARGLTVIWTHSALSAFETASVQPLILLHQVVLPPSRPATEALVADSREMLTPSADSRRAASPSSPVGSASADRSTPLPANSLAHAPSTRPRHPPGRDDAQVNLARWVVPTAVGHGGVHASRQGAARPDADSSFVDVPPPVLTAG